MESRLIQAPKAVLGTIIQEMNSHSAMSSKDKKTQKYLKSQQQYLWTMTHLCLSGLQGLLSCLPSCVYLLHAALKFLTFDTTMSYLIVSTLSRGHFNITCPLAISITVLSYPMALFVSKILGSWGGKGVFNYKEHAMIVITTSCAYPLPMQNSIIIIQRILIRSAESSKGIDVGIPQGILLFLLPKLLGFGICGLLLKVLIQPAVMVWPSNLVISNLIYTMAGSQPTLTNRRVWMLIIVSVAVFFYQLVPLLFAPLLKYVSLLCIVLNFISGTKTQITRTFFHQIGSGYFGGGMMSISFDLSSISMYTPIISPLWTTFNVVLANIFLGWIITPVADHFWPSLQIPLYGLDIYHVNGSIFNISTIINSFDSDVSFRISQNRLIIYGCLMASAAAMISQFMIYYFKFTREAVFSKEIDDVHSRRISSSYRTVPFWFYMILTLAASISIASLFRFQKESFDCDWLIVGVAVVFSLIFAIPVGVINAISNYSIDLSTFSQLLMGYMRPGDILTNATFDFLTTSTLLYVIQFGSMMKLAYYLKISPTTVVFGIIYGSVVASSASYLCLDFILRTPSLLGPSSDAYYSQIPQVTFNSAILFGAINSFRAFTVYHGFLYSFAIGFILPILFYTFHIIFPKIGFHYVNWPIIFQSAGLSTIYGSNGLITTLIVAGIFQYYIKNYKRRWYDKYTYIFSAGVDLGILLCTLVVVLVTKLFNFGLGHYSMNPDTNYYGPDYCGVY